MMMPPQFYIAGREQQKLSDLGQFLAMNSEAAQEKLDGAERRIRDLEVG